MGRQKKWNNAHPETLKKARKKYDQKHPTITWRRSDEIYAWLRSRVGVDGKTMTDVIERNLHKAKSMKQMPFYLELVIRDFCSPSILSIDFKNSESNDETLRYRLIEDSLDLGSDPRRDWQVSLALNIEKGLIEMQVWAAEGNHPYIQSKPIIKEYPPTLKEFKLLIVSEIRALEEALKG